MKIETAEPNHLTETEWQNGLSIIDPMEMPLPWQNSSEPSAQEIPITVIRPLNRVERALDRVLQAPMNYMRSKEYRAVNGEPHETHWYHGQALTEEELSRLDPSLMAGGVIDAKVKDVKRVQSSNQWSMLHGTNPINHLPNLPGSELLSDNRTWKTVQTLEVVDYAGPWYVGWIAFEPVIRADGTTTYEQRLHEFSRKPIGTQQEPLKLVRVLAPHTPVIYFALDENGKQLKLKTVEISSLDGYSLDPNKSFPVPQR